MIDHFGFAVTDYPRALEFYGKALAPLGYALIMQVSAETNASGYPAAGFGEESKPDFWIGAEGARGVPVPMHVAIAVKTRAMVDAFHRAALAHGGRDNGAPGERDYHPGYYAAFVLDPDGNNVEAVFHGEAKRSAASVTVSFSLPSETK